MLSTDWTGERRDADGTWSAKDVRLISLIRKNARDWLPAIFAINGEILLIHCINHAT